MTIVQGASIQLRGRFFHVFLRPIDLDFDQILLTTGPKQELRGVSVDGYHDCYRMFIVF